MLAAACHRDVAGCGGLAACWLSLIIRALLVFACTHGISIARCLALSCVFAQCSSEWLAVGNHRAASLFNRLHELDLVRLDHKTEIRQMLDERAVRSMIHVLATQ